jgi:RimJ/RimL family protein N-acetyltransferase
MIDIPVPLETPRLLLRPYEAGDLAGLHAMFGDEDVCRYLPWEPMTREQATAKLAQRLTQAHIEADGDPLLLAAVERETGTVVGEFMLLVTSLASRQGEIGWSLVPSVQGRGLATEGAREVLRVGFEVVGLHRMAARSDARNLASIRVMQRLGMRREAEFIESAHYKGEWANDVVYALLESEWRDRR